MMASKSTSTTSPQTSTHQKLEDAKAPRRRHDPLLDSILDRILRGETAEAADALFHGLDAILAQSDDEAWRHFAKELVPQHPLRKLIHEDPLAERAYSKPRGYAGDAVLLDYIYGILDAKDRSPLARWLYDYCSRRYAIRAVRARRQIVASAIDSCAEKRPGDVRILSVACGHLREEAQVSRAIAKQHIRELVALDSDPKSLEVAKGASSCITTEHMSVRQLLTGKVDFGGGFDLIYSSGLYDYLDDRVAQRLTRSLFSMLAPGGSIMLCNFLPSTPDIGFIESFMDWDLLYRDRQEILSFANEIDPQEIGVKRYFEDAFRAIGYVQITKR